MRKCVKDLKNSNFDIDLIEEFGYIDETEFLFGEEEEEANYFKENKMHKNDVSLYFFVVVVLQNASLFKIILFLSFVFFSK